jgi:hypothetical protein
MATRSANANGNAKLIVDISKLGLTNRDMLDFKEKVGRSMPAAFANADTPEWKADPDFLALTAFTWILLRKQRPDFTWDDALDTEVDSADLLEVVRAAVPTLAAPAATTTTTSGTTTGTN